MTKEEVKRIIKKYSRVKLMIVGMLILSTIFMLLCVIVMQFVHKAWISYIAVVSYIFMLLVVLAAFAFPLGKPLTEFISLTDYKAILQYLMENVENLKMDEYLDGLILIKRALNKTVYHPHLSGLPQKLVEHLRYLQGIEFREDTGKGIPEQLYNRSYTKQLCSVLLQQINAEVFSEAEIEKIVYNEDKTRKQRVYINLDYIYIFCTILLMCFVLTKIVFSINEDLYRLTSSHVFVRVFYNVGADVIAMYYAIESKISKNKS